MSPFQKDVSTPFIRWINFAYGNFPLELIMLNINMPPYISYIFMSTEKQSIGVISSSMVVSLPFPVLIKS